MSFFNKKVSLIFFSIILIFFVSFLFIQPFYQTNDDILMMWMTEGIGAHLNEKNPFIIYQHFILGFIYQYIPDFFSLNGYNLISVLLMILFFTISANSLLNQSKNQRTTIVSLILFYAIVIVGIINFQFTIISSMCFGSYLFLKDNKSKVKYLFLILSFLIRLEMGVLITFIFLISKNESIRTKFRFFGCLALLAVTLFFSNRYMGINYGSDQYYYENHQLWRFLNNKCGDYILKNFDNWKVTGVTKNDIELVNQWFLVDKNLKEKIASPELLKFCDKVTFTDKIQMGFESVFKLFEKELLGLTLIIIFLLIIRGKKDYFYVFGWFILAMFLAGFSGRPSQVRIYYGPMIVLILYSLRHIKFNKLNTGIITILLTLMFYQTIFPRLNLMRWRKKNYSAEVQTIKQSIDENPKSKIWWWAYGGNFLEWLYPLTNQNQLSSIPFRNVTILWGHEKDPYGLKLHEEFVQDFTGPIGVNIIFYDYIYDEYHSMFDKYCEEHYSAKLNKNLYKGPPGTKLVVANLSCH